MSRRIPRVLFPHVNAVSVAPLTGSNAAGRIYGADVVLKRALIIDGTGLTGTQYEREAEVVGVVYCERDAIDAIPVPDSRVKLWLGERDEHDAFVKRTEHYKDPRLGDLLVLVLR